MHTAIATTAKGVIDAIQVLTPDPGPFDVVVKVEYSALVPADSYTVDHGLFVQSYPSTLGFNAAGIVAKVGRDVKDLVIGDRITALALGYPEGRALQQYTILPENLCAKVPDSLDLVLAATIPDNFIAAFFTLFDKLSLPIPDAFPATTPPPSSNAPILVYGSGSTAGIFTVQLLKLAGYTNILTTASSKHHQYLTELGATHNFDHVSPTLAEDIQSTVGGRVPIVIDTIATMKTLTAISKFIDNHAKLAILLPVKDGEGLTDGNIFFELPKNLSLFTVGVQIIYIRGGEFQKESEYLKLHLMPFFLTSILASDLLKPNKVVMMDEKDGDMKSRSVKGLELLRSGKVRGAKIVVKIAH